MKIAFAAASTSQARKTVAEIEQRYGNCPLAEADYVVTVGGDGVVLRTLHSLAEIEGGDKTPIFAMRKSGSVGFLCNEFSIDNLQERLEAAQQIILHPLAVSWSGESGKVTEAIAFNEVAILRESPQSVKLNITVDGVVRLDNYSGDGLLVATPAGSTAYNHSAGGPILPLDANTLVMTAICGFRPRRWLYAIMSQDSVTTVEVLEPMKRPVRIEAGAVTAHAVIKATIRLDRLRKFRLSFDPEQHLSERIMREQFMM